MKPAGLLIIVFLCLPFISLSQSTFSLNTARNCTYMKEIEKEMIYEINLLRSDPTGYSQYIQEDYDVAKQEFEGEGKGEQSYSVSYSYKSINGRERLTKTDTIWHYANEERLKAIESLIDQLRNMGPLHILLPDKGLYSAAVKHANDQTAHHWTLGHRGSDGSWPWDRIRKYSSKMVDGNENLAGIYPEPSARDIVIMLLIDAGIPGYGHRATILNPNWTHVACYCAGLQDGMYQWVQEFGRMEVL